MEHQRSARSRRHARVALLVGGFVLVGALVAPLIVVHTTNAAIERAFSTLDAWGGSAVPAARRCAPEVRLTSAEVAEATRVCGYVVGSLSEETRCEALLARLERSLAPLDRCRAGRREAGEVCVWVRSRARSGGAACLRAALAQYRSRVVSAEDWSLGGFDRAADLGAGYLYRCAGRAPDDARRELAELVWDEANRTLPPHAYAAERLRESYLLLGVADGVIKRFVAARVWLGEVESLLSRGPPPDLAHQRLESFAPGPVAAGVIPEWMHVESELRSLALHLRGEPSVPAAWQRDLDLRRLTLHRDGACLAFVGEAFPGRPRSARFCPEGSPEVAAREWLVETSRTLLAWREEHGVWPAPIDEPRMPVDESGAYPDARWTAIGFAAPRPPGLRAALRSPRPGVAAEGTERLLQVAVVRGDALRVYQVALGVQGGGTAETSRAIYGLTANEVTASGFCRAPCD